MFLRLAVFLTCIGLATSRIGLVAHEFVGHGGAAILVGGEVLQVRLFWFAGGWIRYAVPEPSTTKFLVVALAGIALELVAGALVWALARHRILRGIGAAFVIHACWYLAVGAWHGFGDGALLAKQLGDDRIFVALPAGIAVVTAAFFGARGVIGALAETLPRHRLAGVLGAMAIALAIHGGLGLAELTLRRDTTYAATMRPERDRVILAELAELQRQAPRPPTPEELALARARLEAKHQAPFPFAIVLGIATALALALGAWRSPIGVHTPVATRTLGRVAIAAILAIAITVGLDLIM